MSLLLDLLPQYSKSLDLKKDFGLDGESTTLDLYLRAVDSQIYELISESIGVLLTFSDLNNVEDKYLPYIGYTLGYDWNYYLTSEVQRNILKNILDIYKRKGTKFSIYFTLHNLDTNNSVSLDEPYKYIYTLDRSGLEYNSDSVVLWNKTVSKTKRIDVDDDGYFYALTSDGFIYKYDMSNNTILWNIEDSNIVDMVIDHRGVQKDYLYYITIKDGKYDIVRIKTYNYDEKTKYDDIHINLSLDKAETQYLQSAKVVGLDIDSVNNLIIYGKKRVLLYDFSNYIDDYSKEKYPNKESYFESKKVIELSDTCTITHLIADDDDNIILSHIDESIKVDSEIKTSHGILKEYKRIIGEDGSISYDETPIIDYIVGYDSSYEGNTEINAIQYNSNYIYIIVNNRNVYRLTVEDNDINSEDYVNSELYSTVLYDNSDTYSENNDYYLTNGKNIVLNNSEYPDNTCLELKIYDSDGNIFKDYTFDEENKTIKLNEELSSDEILNIKVDEYNVSKLFDYVNEKQRIITLTDTDILTILENGLIVYYNYNGVNGERLIPEVDYLIDYTNKFIKIIREDLPYDTLVTVGYISNNSFKRLYEYEVDKVRNIQIDNIIAEEFMTAPIISTLDEVEVGGVYKLNNTNEYYYYEDDELKHKNYGLYLYNSVKDEIEEYTLIDNTNNIPSDCYNRAYRNIQNDTYYIYLEKVGTTKTTKIYLDDTYTFKIKRLFDYSNITDKKIVNSADSQDSYYNIRENIVFTNKQRPSTVNNRVGFGLDVFLNNELLSDDDYTFDESTNKLHFNTVLPLNAVVCIKVYEYKRNILSIGIDNKGNISDYVAIGFSNCFRVYNKNSVEMHSYNTLFPVTYITNRLDDDKIYFVSNGNILNYMYCDFTIGGSLTSPNYYSDGILSIKTDLAPDLVLEAVEYVRPAGWKLLIENSSSVFYNTNSKTYKSLDYQKNVTSDEDNTEGYPNYAVDTYQIVYDEETKTYDRKLVHQGEYEFLSATLNDDLEPIYKKDEDKYRKIYIQSFANIEPMSGKDNGQLKNVLEPLDNESRYYREEFLDSIQYSNSNNGPISDIVMVGQTFDIDSLRIGEDLYIYDSLFEDTITNEETNETTDNFTLFRNSVGFVSIK